MRSRLGEAPQQGLSELARSSAHIPAAQAQALRACKHAGLIWHAFTHFRRVLQVLRPSSTTLFMLLDHSMQHVHSANCAPGYRMSGLGQEAGC